MKNSQRKIIAVLLMPLLTAIAIYGVTGVTALAFHNYASELQYRAAVSEYENAIEEKYRSLKSQYIQDLIDYEKQINSYLSDMKRFHEEELTYAEQKEAYTVQLIDYGKSVEEYEAAVKAYEKECEDYELYYTRQVEQYNADVSDYPNKCAAEDARQFKELMKQGMVFECYGSRSVRDDNHVGNEWSSDLTIYGEDNGKIILKLGGTVKVYSRIVEEDSFPDVGTYSDSHRLVESDFEEGFEIEHTVYVRENRGRYTGNVATIEVNYRFKPVEGQFTPDKSKYPSYPTEPVYEKPVFDVVPPEKPIKPLPPIKPDTPVGPTEPEKQALRSIPPSRDSFSASATETFSQLYSAKVIAVFLSLLCLSLGYRFCKKAYGNYRFAKEEEEWEKHVISREKEDSKQINGSYQNCVAGNDLPDSGDTDLESEFGRAFVCDEDDSNTTSLSEEQVDRTVEEVIPGEICQLVPSIQKTIIRNKVSLREFFISNGFDVKDLRQNGGNLAVRGTEEEIAPYLVVAEELFGDFAGKYLSGSVLFGGRPAWLTKSTK